MKAYTKISLIFLIPLFAALTGCIKEEQYPIEPKIEFGGFTVVRDITGKDSVGVLTISYTDGNGDIGLYDYDTVEPFKYNYYLRFMQFHNKQLSVATCSLNVIC